MDTVIPDFTSLFAQLGLDNDDRAIEQFIDTHKLPANVRIAEAPYWNTSQRLFFEEAITQDAQWAETIEHLDSALHM
ncbi:hypothetical protein HR45_12355 [Shewanella mangrovi]|uniref:DUF2789 domain-containing protein n=1 Tax=Shewanella mangrovi TaxID=1515746 RepID=A0A094JXM7_9GAMM|nr:DUF2789 domain-containing protein [Shewanella mangrovi]KFZ37196.1 hypothetical protein HR45_12355 [Shewanella mangrovi]